MIKKLFAAFLIVIASGVLNAQSFKEQFYKAIDFMVEDNYYSALPLLFELEKKDDKNANIKSMIGYCYLHTSYEKYRAIPYYEFVLDDENVQKNITPFYETGNHKEKKAPVECYRFMGQAYHSDYQFAKALDSYFTYQEFLNEINKDELKDVKRDIRITRNAMTLKANPTEMTLQAMGNNLNTEFPEYRPIVNADETVMIFTSRRDTGPNPEKGDDDMYFEDIYISYRKDEDDDWSDPVLVHTNINTKEHEACLYLSADGQEMYIYKNDENDGSIYESHLDGETWSKPKPLESAINSEFWETHANRSADGKTISFVSDRPGGHGGRDIWFIRQLPNGDWSKVKNAGPTINTEWDEESPFFHPDGTSLYFSSQGHATMGGFDVFQSKLDPGGEWGPPENIGYPVNTTGDDVFFVPTSDGKRAYFSSLRDGGMGRQDIYIIGMISAEKKALTIYKGYAKDTGGNVIQDIIITVYDESTGEVSGEYRPNKKTGKFLFIMKPGHTYEVTYDVQGMIASETITIDDAAKFKTLGRLIVKEGDKLTIKKDSISDEDVAIAQQEHDADIINLINIDVTSQIPKAKFEELLEKVKQVLDSSKTLVLKNLEFYFDRTKLLEKSRPDIQLIYDYMNNDKTVRMRVEGHTDSKGSSKYNLHLSKGRAKKVKEILVKMGIEASRLETEGFGEEKPLLPNTNKDGSDNKENRQHNRRVEFRKIS
jgi:outer membrane protein OmpA-like peptidoglycan-associated protein